MCLCIRSIFTITSVKCELLLHSGVMYLKLFAILFCLFFRSLQLNDQEIKLTTTRLGFMMSLLAYIASRFWQTADPARYIKFLLYVVEPSCPPFFYGRTGGGRFMRAGSLDPSLSTPSRSATIINWQWFGRTSYNSKESIMTVFLISAHSIPLLCHGTLPDHVYLVLTE